MPDRTNDQRYAFGARERLLTGGPKHQPCEILSGRA
jgi:hypothetical protein